MCKFNEYIKAHNLKKNKAKWYLKTICFNKASTFSKEIEEFSLFIKTKKGFQIFPFPHKCKNKEWMDDGRILLCLEQSKFSNYDDGFITTGV